MNPTSFHLYFRSRFIASLILVACSMILSCEKEPEPLTKNSCIRGSVNVFDWTLTQVPAVKVTASGPYGSVSGITDEMGMYLLTGLGNGTYNINFSLEGYGSITKYGIQVFGYDTANVNYVQMLPIPKGNYKVPVLDDPVIDENGWLTISTDITNCQINSVPVRFFFATDDQVSFDHYEYSESSTFDYLCMYHLYLYERDIESGKKVYLTAYICNPMDGGYLDLYYNKTVYSTLIPESKYNVITFTMP